MHELRKLSPHIEAASQILLDFIDKKEVIRCVSHHDADGVAAAAIMAQTLMRLDAKFHLSCIKGLTSKALKNLNEEPYKLIIFLDMGSGNLHLIEDTLYDKKVLIFDHHPLSVPDSDILQVNPHVEGLDGTREISGAGVAYLFARTLGNNVDLAQIALIGACGDIQLRKGAVGLNKFIVQEAQENGFIVEKKDIRLFGREKYSIDKALEYTFDPYLSGLSNNPDGCRKFLDTLDINIKENGNYKKIMDLTYEEKKKITSELVLQLMREGVPAHTATTLIGPVYEIVDGNNDLCDIAEYTTLVNACGRMGETADGILVCFDDKQAVQNSFVTLDDYRNEVCLALDFIKSNFETRDGYTIAYGKEKISPSLAGALSSIVMLSALVPEDRPFIFVTESEKTYKISARGNSALVAHGIHLGNILSDISSQLGGNGGGHDVAAGAHVPKDKLDELVEQLDSKIPVVNINAS